MHNRKYEDLNFLLDQKKEIQKVYHQSEKNEEVERWYRAEIRFIDSKISNWKKTFSPNQDPQSPPFIVHYAEDESSSAKTATSKNVKFLKKGSGALAWLSKEKKSASLPSIKATKQPKK